MQGLFARPRALLQRQVQRAAAPRTAAQWHRTQPHIAGACIAMPPIWGRVGNIILQRTMTAYYEPRLEDFRCTADACAVDCTHHIDLQPLPLPVGREALQHLGRPAPACPASVPAPQHLLPRLAAGLTGRGNHRLALGRAAVAGVCPLPPALLRRLRRAIHSAWSGRRRLTSPPQRAATPLIYARAPRHPSWSKPRSVWVYRRTPPQFPEVPQAPDTAPSDWHHAQYLYAAPPV